MSAYDLTWWPTPRALDSVADAAQRYDGTHAGTSPRPTGVYVSYHFADAADMMAFIAATDGVLIEPWCRHLTVTGWVGTE